MHKSDVANFIVKRFNFKEQGLIAKRKGKYEKQISKIKTSKNREIKIYELEKKLVLEFGNENEKNDLEHLPIWASLDYMNKDLHEILD